MAIQSHTGWTNSRRVMTTRSSGSGIVIFSVWSGWRARDCPVMRPAIDEEDVALSAFQSFCDRARKGQFPELANRDDLWRVLFAITVRKAIGAVRHQTRKKRGGGHVLGETALGHDEQSQAASLARFLSREPTPDAAAELADQLDTLFARLKMKPCASSRFQKLHGLTSEEIGKSLEISTRTVDRKLQLIRAIWAEREKRDRSDIDRAGEAGAGEAGQVRY